MDLFGEFITDLQKSTLKKSEAAVLSTLKLQFGVESRFFSLEPPDKQSRLVLCTLLYCMFVWVSRGGNAWAAHRQTAVLFIVFGIEGLRLFTTQFVVWDPILTYFANAVNWEICLAWPIRLSKLKEFCYIFTTCYFPSHFGSDERYV